jgi:hypothetical protein
MKRATLFPLLIAATLIMAACGEIDQGKTPQTANRGDTPPWQGAKNEFVVKGWTPGDKASWEAQERTRSMGQNEYNRISSNAH